MGEARSRFPSCWTWARCQDNGVSDPEREKRWAELFDQLDLNKDGRIDANELRTGLSAWGVVRSEVDEIVRVSDTNHDGQLDFKEFTQYLRTHEKELRLMFHSLDRNNDGHIDVAEIQLSLHSLGVNVSTEQASRILQSIDRDGTMTIDWSEWRDHFLFNPLHNMEDIAHYWKHSLMLDIGEQLTVPDEFSEKERRSGVVWRQLVAGAMAGAVSRTGTAPLDRLKVFLQVHGSSGVGLLGSLRGMVQEGGLRSLWRGNGINVLKIAPESAIKFMAYEQIKWLIRGSKEGASLRVQERFIAGSLAGATAQTIIYPMEDHVTLKKTAENSAICLTKEGVRAFYKGYVPNTLGIIPYAGIDLAVYETLKNAWLQRYCMGSADPGVLVLLGCGTVSSTCGQLASYPLALIHKTDSRNSYYMSFCLFCVPGLYRGIAPNFLKVIPAVSISYVVYEHMKKALGVGS
uniref:Calcium-binding mitochondrial carrier protein SCaMC-3-like n=1 Tax=Sinocyclocheilus rhinocerous TaxID=307959 RepID=A0A673NL97_9TELE